MWIFQECAFKKFTFTWSLKPPTAQTLTIIEDWKWNTAVGLMMDGRAVVAQRPCEGKFFKGAFLEDPHGLFNAGLEAKVTRAIDFHEGDKIDEPAVKDLVRAP